MFNGTDPREFQKCVFCPKTFVNESFLLSHISRRHEEEMLGMNMSKLQFRQESNIPLAQPHNIEVLVDLY